MVDDSRVTVVQAMDGTEREQAYLAVLRPFYHPVATEQELDGVGVDEHGMPRVLGRELLGERIVIARLEGQVTAMHGTCPHRGVALERGWVNADCTAVVCRYHGFEWGAAGRLRRIPALDAAGKHLPTGEDWRVETFPTVVKYGLVWVCLDRNARFPVLQAAPENDPSYVALPIAEQIWQAGCGRITEAFLDTYHFAFTHWGSLGDPVRPEAPKAEVTIHDDYFYLDYCSRQPNSRAVNYGSEAAAGESEAPEFLVSRYQGWAVPNAVYLLKMTGAIRFGILAAVCPLAPRRSKLYRILYADRDWKVDHRDLAENQDRINREDREIVETARPWELSTDLDAELQTYMDRPTVTYRRWLAGLGLELM
jgi:phenylpropionate dioxygenase-like ring-hydroxylating dioxygenase large terminal subunit